MNAGRPPWSVTRAEADQKEAGIGFARHECLDLVLVRYNRALGLDQLLLPVCDFGLRQLDFDRREHTDLHSRLVLGQCLSGKFERALLHLQIFSREDEIPIGLLSSHDQVRDLGLEL